ncbi:acyltransferase [Arthrobacter sp. CDRTa11]|uniref:acyltransferase family protein n=1 Tax=Arthrobacter sp. CDRTa11 TaxID=2651199 RepID=UPI002265F8E6|nr:acyltransferase family protein [Arthrobacter sp. CDRTa11]UZX04329.1 acyltransferase [Arthrobacter sp. CDRTa11]
MTQLLTLKRGQKRGTAKPINQGIRPDIQGLRALAVLAVIADHLFHWPSGGFVGVDVFFVISGFLITGLLLREHERTGRISFVDFYRRRVKRILPASVLVLAVTLAGSYLIYSTTRFQSVLWDVVWAFLFAGNWRFAVVGTDYFASDAVSPIQHFWSLAVEEQFYFVWPWLMLLIFFVVGKRSSNGTAGRAAVGAAIALISLASFAWALAETASAPSMAYFSTFSRAWELGVGAGLAVAAPVLGQLPAKLRPILSWLGLTGILVSVAVINSGSPFPAPAALLPVLASALVIAAGTGASTSIRLPAVLTNRISGYLGDISYSLYLWHFPVVIIGADVFPEAGWQYQIGAVAATFFLAVVAYNLFEDPIRKSDWLKGKDKMGRSRREIEVSDRFKQTALFALAAMTAVVVVAAFSRFDAAPQTAVALPAATAPSAAATAAPVQYGAVVTALQKEITQALQAPEWPALAPSLDDAIGSRQAREDISACGMPDEYDPAQCVVNPTAQKSAIILGNSMAMTYAAPLIDSLGQGWSVNVHGAYGCPFSAVFIPTNTASLAAACEGKNDEGIRMVQESKPDVVFIINTYTTNKPAGADKPLPAAEWAASIEAAVQEMNLSGTRVVFITPPPADKDIAKCYTKVSKPADCISGVTSLWYDNFDAESAMAKRIGAAVVDTRSLFCLDQSCPAFVSETPMKLDTSHMTVEYGSKITSALRELLAEQKIL